MKARLIELLGVLNNYKEFYVTHIAVGILLAMFYIFAVAKPKESKLSVRETCQKETVDYEKAIYLYELKQDNAIKDVGLMYTKLNCNDLYDQHGKKLEERYMALLKKRTEQDEKNLKLRLEIDAFSKVEQQLANLITMEITRSCR